MNNLKPGFAFSPPPHWRVAINQVPSHWDNVLFTWCIGDLSSIQSQCGQAEVVKHLMEWKNLKNYIDIGANDGVTQSSTYLLYQAGFTGILIEPNIYLMESLIKHRSKDKVLCCGISDNTELLELLTSANNSTIGTLNLKGHENNINRLKRESKDIQSILCPIISSETLGDYINTTMPELGFLKVDCEGCELAVLKDLLRTLNINSKPCIIEVENNYMDGKVAELLLSFGYSNILVMDSFVEIWILDVQNILKRYWIKETINILLDFID